MVNVFGEVSELEFEHATVNNRLRSTQNRERLFEKEITLLMDLLFMIFPFSTDRGVDGHKSGPVVLRPQGHPDTVRIAAHE